MLLDLGTATISTVLGIGCLFVFSNRIRGERYRWLRRALMLNPAVLLLIAAGYWTSDAFGLENASLAFAGLLMLVVPISIAFGIVHVATTRTRQ